MTYQPQLFSLDPLSGSLAKLAVSTMALLLLAGCITTHPAVIEGTAMYRERIALSPDAVFKAEIHDITQADAPADVLGSTIIDPAGQSPFRFRIPYDATAVKLGRSYAVRAFVKHRDRLLFTSDQVYPVLGDAHGPLEVLLVSAGAIAQMHGFGELPASYEREMPGANSLIRWHLDLLPQGHYQLRLTYLDKPQPNQFDEIGRWHYDEAKKRLEISQKGEKPLYFRVEAAGGVLQQLGEDDAPIVSRFDQPLRRLPEPALIEPRLKVTGMFTYLADAALISLCDDGRRLPVAMEGDYLALEKAYLATRPQPGQALLVEVDGLIASRLSMEDSQPPQPTLIVERFKNVRPRERCGQP